MNNIKKALCMTVLYLFLVNLLTVNVLALGTSTITSSSSTNTIKYLNYNYFQADSVIQYKDKTIFVNDNREFDKNYGMTWMTDYTMINSNNIKSKFSNYKNATEGQIINGKMYFNTVSITRNYNYYIENNKTYNYYYDFEKNNTVLLKNDRQAVIAKSMSEINRKLGTSYKALGNSQDNLILGYNGTNYNYSNINGKSCNDKGYITMYVYDIYSNNGEVWNCFSFQTQTISGFGILNGSSLKYFQTNSKSSISFMDGYNIIRTGFEIDSANKLRFVETNSKSEKYMVTLKKDGTFTKIKLGFILDEFLLLINNNDYYTFVNNKLVKYSLQGNKYIKVKEFTSVLPSSLTKDKNGDLWAINEANGHRYVGKLENNNFANKYEINKSMKYLSIYDDKHLTVNNGEIYTTINRKYTGNSNLSELNIKNGNTKVLLNTPFKSSITSYIINVPSNVSSLEFDGIAEDSSAKIVGEGVKTLAYGKNVVYIMVVADDGTKKTYTINVNRALPAKPLISITSANKSLIVGGNNVLTVNGKLNTSVPANIAMVVFDKSNNIVAILKQSNVSAGSVIFKWDGKVTKENNLGLKAGTYVPTSKNGIVYKIKLYAQQAGGKSISSEQKITLYSK